MAAGFVLQTPDGSAYAVDRPMTIGRGYACQIVLADGRVSRHHATAWAETGRLYLRDENASNGTFVNGRRLAGGETVALQPGDQIQLGSALLLAGLAADPITPASPPAPRPDAPAPAATLQMQAPPALPTRSSSSSGGHRRAPDLPAAPAGSQPRSRLPLLLGCGALGICLAFALAVIGAVATGALPLTFGIPTAPPSGTVSGFSEVTETPAATAAPQGSGLATPAAGTGVPLTPVVAAPAATPLAVERFAEGSASLGDLIAGLNVAELRFVQVAAADAPPAELDQALQAVAAQAMRVGVLAQQLSESAAADAGVSDAALMAADNYNAVARLAFALVIEAHTLRDDLAGGVHNQSQAMHLIAEYGSRLWQPGFDDPPPDTIDTSAPPPDLAGRVAHSPFLAYTLQPVEAPPVQFLGPDAVAAILAVNPEPEARLQGWLVVSSETITRTLAVPAHGLPPTDPFAAELAAQLQDPAYHASPEGAFTARHVAQAYLALLGGGLTAPPPLPGSGLLRPATYQATPPQFTVGLASRAVAGGLNPAPGANPPMPNMAGGQITSIFKSPFQTSVIGGQASQNAAPQVISYGREANPSHTVQLTVMGLNASYGSEMTQFEPGKGAFGIGLRYEPMANALNPGAAARNYTIVCQATGLAVQAQTVGTASGIHTVVFQADVGVDYFVRCFILANVQGNGRQLNGLVVGQTEMFTVHLPGNGPDGDQDGVADEFDQCPQEKEDRDQVVDFDGCPETDADADGLLDSSDGCPTLAGPAPTGCPEADADSDGVPDYRDDCPQRAEDHDNVNDRDGCPEFDEDLDGVLDEVDRCPEQKEDKDGFEDEDGCPERDNDADGFPDEEDFCRNEAETVNGYVDTDGCPDQWPKLTLTGTINEGAVDNFGNAFGFTTQFNLTLDFASGTLVGTLTSTGAARIEFTCFNVNDPSEIYDSAEAAYAITYSAAATGGGLTSGAPASVAIAPQGTVNASVARAYTHQECTHLNDNPISGQGPFTGAGTLTVIATDLGSATVTLNWRTSGFSAIGSWTGWGTFN